VDRLTGNLQDLVYAVPFFALLVGSLLLGKLLYARTSRYDFDVELTGRDNGAFGVHLALYLLGLTIAVAGTLYRGVFPDVEGLAVVAGFCLVCVGLMRLSLWVNARFLLRDFHIEKELVQDRNAGTGFVVGGACVATGLMLNGALSVEVDTTQEMGARIGQALLCTLVFFVLGQLLILAGGWVFRRIARFDVHQAIERDDNMAAGVSYGGFLVALGMIVRVALVGAGPDLGVEVLTSLVYAVVGLALLVATRLVVAAVLMPTSSFRKEIADDKNPAAAGVAAVCFIGVALAFGAAVIARTETRLREEVAAALSAANEAATKTPQEGDGP
jgi:uncharacterized membrane protein YjfL (UPF0719 family)